MHCPDKWESTKVQKVQSKKVKKVQKYKKVHKYKSTHNSAIFWATDFRFCMEVHMDCQTKWESIKVQKVLKYKNINKSTKVQKYKNINLKFGHHYRTCLKRRGWYNKDLNHSNIQNVSRLLDRDFS